jgi:flap endonuclease-1
MGVDIGSILVRRTISLESLRGKMLAVDANNLLYQFLALIRTPRGIPLRDDRGNVTSHLVGLVFRSSHLMSDYGVLLVFVFDGRPPTLKEPEILKRRKVREKAFKEYESAVREGDYAKAFSKAVMTSRLSQNLVSDAKRLLSILGIPYVQAPSEGEAQAAYMARANDVWACNSRDYDSILFGAPRLVRYVTISGREFLPKRGLSRPLIPELIMLDEVLSHLGITREQLIDIAILVGTDFNRGVKGIGPKKGLDLIRKYESIENLPRFLKEKVSTDYDKARRLFLDPPITRDYGIRFSGLQESELFEFLCDERGFSRRSVETVARRMKGFYSSLSQSNLAKWI